MLAGLLVLPSNVCTISVSLRGVPTSVMALVAAAVAGAAAPTAAAVGAGAPLVGLTSGGVGDGVQAATNPEISTTPANRLLSFTTLVTMGSLPVTLLPWQARRAAFQTQDSEQQAHPDAFAPRPARSNPTCRANGPWHAGGGC